MVTLDTNRKIIAAAVNVLIEQGATENENRGIVYPQSNGEACLRYPFVEWNNGMLHTSVESLLFSMFPVAKAIFIAYLNESPGITLAW